MKKLGVSEGSAARKAKPGLSACLLPAGESWWCPVREETSRVRRPKRLPSVTCPNEKPAGEPAALLLLPVPCILTVPGRADLGSTDILLVSTDIGHAWSSPRPAKGVPSSILGTCRDTWPALVCPYKTLNRLPVLCRLSRFYFLLLLVSTTLTGLACPGQVQGDTGGSE